MGVVAGDIQRDEEEEVEDVVAVEVGQDHEEARGRAPVGDHVHHGAELRSCEG
jgi:hypothetical protein